MHGNRAYWGATTGELTIDGTSAPTKSCTGAGITCTPTELAAFDIDNWRKEMATHFPSFTAKVSCAKAVSLEVECLLSVWWDEKYVAVNRSTASAAGAVQSAIQLYTLVVRP
jgi:type IV pilus assembly protein PilV